MTSLIQNVCLFRSNTFYFNLFPIFSQLSHDSGNWQGLPMFPKNVPRIAWCIGAWLQTVRASSRLRRCTPRAPRPSCCLTTGRWPRPSGRPGPTRVPSRPDGWGDEGRLKSILSMQPAAPIGGGHVPPVTPWWRSPCGVPDSSRADPSVSVMGFICDAKDPSITRHQNTFLVRFHTAAN